MIDKLLDEYEKNRKREITTAQSSKAEDLRKLIQDIDKNIRVKGIPYLIHLHHNQILEKTLKNIKAIKGFKPSKIISTIQTIINMIFAEYLQSINKAAGNQFKELLKIPQYSQLKPEKDDLAVQFKEYHVAWQKLFAGFLNLKNNFTMHSYNSYVEDELLNFQAKDGDKILTKNTAEEHFCINWLKTELQKMRNDENNLCCRLIFFDQMKIKAAENNHVEYKKYYWPITSPNIIFHLKKTIVGFLNTSGGIIYIGIQEDKQKITAVTSMEIRENKKLEVYNFFKDLVDKNINPKHKGFDVINKNVPILDCHKILINDYISLEMMPVVNEQTLLPIKNCNKEGDSKYIVKIFVKVGHPKHLYYLITNQQTIDFFVRQDRNVEKKPFEKAYEEIYNRLDTFEKYKKDNEGKKEDQQRDYKSLPKRQTFHNDCRYKMDIEIDIDSDSDDDTF